MGRQARDVSRGSAGRERGRPPVGCVFECRIFKESKQLLLCWTLCVHVAVSVEGMVDGNAGISFFSLKILKG